MKHPARLAALLPLLLLVGCGGGGGATGNGNSPLPKGPDITVSSVLVTGTTSEPCTVTVNGQADTDVGLTTFSTLITVSDPGMIYQITKTLPVVAVDTASHTTTSNLIVEAYAATWTTP